jgi:hypothetical protein
MKKCTLFVLLIAVFALAFSSAAYAAAPTVWNFEKDFDNAGLLELTAVAIPAGTYNAPGFAGVTDPGPYTGSALDNRGRAERIYISKNTLQPYNFGAAGGAPIYSPTTVASGIQGYIGDAAWNTWLLTQSVSNQAAYPAAIDAAGVWGAPYYKMNNAAAPTPDPHGAYVYLQWWAVEAGNPAALVDVTANTGSPHGGFTTSSIKCAVCHSVHTAAPGGSATAPVADNLLRMNAVDACAYCHVEAANTVGNPVYGGRVDGLDGDVGHALGSNPTCSECHGSVHGAGCETIPPLNGKLLTLATDNGGSVVDRIESIDTLAAAQGFTGPVTGFYAADYESAVEFAAHPEMEDQAVGIFCQGCHDGSYAVTVKNASASTLDAAMTAGQFSGHRVMASASGSTNAYAPVAGCTSCHDAQDGFGGQAFPHNWGVPSGAITWATVDGVLEATNQSMGWLLVGEYAGATKTSNNGPMGKLGHAGPDGGTLSDGVCLKCHRGSATTGVGFDY